MPMPIHMEVEGDTQGAIEGECEMKGREKTIEVYGLEHAIEIPTNPQDGQPVGKRRHKQLKVVKLVDKTSPLLAMALCTGEPLTVKLKWFRQAGSKEEHYFTTELQGAHIVDLRTYIPNVFDPKNAEYQHMEECAFAYQKIVWTHETEGKQAEDDWLAPVE
ncbi:MAG TPA: Hcp family type VI secretion system effector [Candidatus Polarisedimenticolia bacterium]|jgi:type VI secretion system secreted protein Hcp|nr:Hcp family type VI secretion system effector [Candidatus Polarisedimenticolia bacterium]